MKAIDQLRQLKAAAVQHGGKLEKLQVSKATYDELGGGEPPLVVEGVNVFPMSEREEILHKAVQFAYYRWDLNMTMEDVASIYKAVPTNELMSLIPIIMDQHIDGHDFEDPTDEYDEDQMNELRGVLKEIGFEHAEI